MIHSSAGDRAVIRIVKRYSSVTLADLMREQLLGMRAAYLLLDGLANRGILKRSGGTRDEPFRWSLRGNDDEQNEQR